MARAYAAAARKALETLELARVVSGVRASLRFPYEDTGAVMRALDAAGARRRSESWAEAARLEVDVPRGDGERLRRLLLDATAGRAQVRFSDSLVLIRLRS